MQAAVSCPLSIHEFIGELLDQFLGEFLCRLGGHVPTVCRVGGQDCPTALGCQVSVIIEVLVSCNPVAERLIIDVVFGHCAFLSWSGLGERGLSDHHLGCHRFVARLLIRPVRIAILAPEIHVAFPD